MKFSLILILVFSYKLCVPLPTVSILSSNFIPVYIIIIIVNSPIRYIYIEIVCMSNEYVTILCKNNNNNKRKENFWWKGADKTLNCSYSFNEFLFYLNILLWLSQITPHNFPCSILFLTLTLHKRIQNTEYKTHTHIFTIIPSQFQFDETIMLTFRIQLLI